MRVWASSPGSALCVNGACVVPDPQWALSLWAIRSPQDARGWVICAVLHGIGTPAPDKTVSQWEDHGTE